MSDDPVSTVLETPEGRLEFQEYFVRRGQRDEVLGIELRGIEDARPTERVLATVSRADAIVLCPSNPVVSVGPIGPARDDGGPGFLRRPEGGRPPDRRRTGAQGSGRQDARLARPRGLATGVARMYAGRLDGMVVDRADEDERAGIEVLGMRVLVRSRLCATPKTGAPRVGDARVRRGIGCAMSNPLSYSQDLWGTKSRLAPILDPGASRAHPVHDGPCRARDRGGRGRGCLRS